MAQICSRHINISLFFSHFDFKFLLVAYEVFFSHARSRPDLSSPREGMDTIANTPSQYANALSRAVFHANAFHRIFSNAIYMTAVAQASIMF